MPSKRIWQGKCRMGNRRSAISALSCRDVCMCRKTSDRSDTGKIRVRRRCSACYTPQSRFRVFHNRAIVRLSGLLIASEDNPTEKKGCIRISSLIYEVGHRHPRRSRRPRRSRIRFRLLCLPGLEASVSHRAPQHRADPPRQRTPVDPHAAESASNPA